MAELIEEVNIRLMNQKVQFSEFQKPILTSPSHLITNLLLVTDKVVTALNYC